MRGRSRFLKAGVRGDLAIFRKLLGAFFGCCSSLWSLKPWPVDGGGGVLAGFFRWGLLLMARALTCATTSLLHSEGTGGHVCGLQWRGKLIVVCCCIQPGAVNMQTDAGQPPQTLGSFLCISGLGIQNIPASTLVCPPCKICWDSLLFSMHINPRPWRVSCFETTLEDFVIQGRRFERQFLGSQEKEGYAFWLCCWFDKAIWIGISQGIIPGCKESFSRELPVHEQSYVLRVLWREFVTL